MMECKQTSEILPWFLNDSLSADEAAQVREHLGSCESCRRELGETGAAFEVFGEHLSTEALVEIAFEGGTRSVPQELAERHLVICQRCAEELAMVRESHATLDAPESTVVETLVDARFGSPPANWSDRSAWKVLAMAASVAAVIATGGWIRTWQLSDGPADAVQASASGDAAESRSARIAELESENRRLTAEGGELSRRVDAGDAERESLLSRLASLSKPQLNVPIVDVYPRGMLLRGEDSEEETFELPAGVPLVTLILNSQLAAEGPVSCRLLDKRGGEVWTVDGLEPSEDGGFTISFSTTKLDRGSYTLLLENGSSGEELESYALTIG